MSKWIAEFELEDGDTMPGHMDLEYKGVKIDFHCRPMWIPCSERLPEEGEVVLTQAKFKDDVKMAVSSRIDYNYWTTWGTRDINIVAWMPLPEPYQEGEQE